MQLEVADCASPRLDVWLSAQLPDVSRTRVQSLIREGSVTVDGASVRCNLHVREGMTVSVDIPPPRETALIPEAIPFDILHEDAHVIVLSKPAGLVVHPAPGHASGTLVNALLHHCRDLAGIGGEKRPGIVHRLDKDTSGVMVAAKHDASMAALVDQFKAGTVRKEYVALVHGMPLPPHGTVESLIGRSRTDRKKMSARPPRGREAVTHYRVAEVLGDVCLVRVRIETGRTHQIRVHMAHLGHPVLGDRQYGARRSRRFQSPVAVPRQMLHAETLAFVHPATREPVAFSAPVPSDMQSVIDGLRG
jgi:23S rRNA pseudouridine1911/1915/1917 synthase